MIRPAGLGVKSVHYVVRRNGASHVVSAKAQAEVNRRAVVDARPRERYRGDDEPVDARPGHIPGALNVPCREHLDETGRFLSPQVIRDTFLELGIVDGGDVISYCGSGVTACHNLLALEVAGLGLGRLYPGSWSQYSATILPASTGPSPR